MYMSGAPLHVLAMNLVQKFREHMREPIPISFSGGLDAHNVARRGGHELRPRHHLHGPAAARRLWPADPLPGESGRGDARAGRDRTSRISCCDTAGRPGGGGDVDAAGLLNTPILVAEATANPRYAWERNKGVPRKIGSKLWLYDCINCDKCVPVCPNDANFVYETRAVDHRVRQLRTAARRRPPRAGRRAARGEGAPVGQLRRRLQRLRQLRRLLPGRRRPVRGEAALLRQPRDLQKHAGANGFYIDWATQHDPRHDRGRARTF